MPMGVLSGCRPHSRRWHSASPVLTVMVIAGLVAGRTRPAPR